MSLGESFDMKDVKPDPVKDRHVVFGLIDDLRRELKNLLNLDVSDVKLLIQYKQTNQYKVRSSVFVGELEIREEAYGPTFYAACVKSSKLILKTLNAKFGYAEECLQKKVKLMDEIQ